MNDDKDKNKIENDIDKVARCREIVSDAKKDAMTFNQAEVLLRRIKDILGAEGSVTFGQNIDPNYDGEIYSPLKKVQITTDALINNFERVFVKKDYKTVFSTKNGNDVMEIDETLKHL